MIGAVGIAERHSDRHFEHEHRLGRETPVRMRGGFVLQGRDERMGRARRPERE